MTFSWSRIPSQVSQIHVNVKWGTNVLKGYCPVDMICQGQLSGKFGALLGLLINYCERTTRLPVIDCFITTLWLNDRQPVKVLKSLNDRQSDIFFKFKESKEHIHLKL